MMRAEHRRLPFSISVDKNAAYPEAFSDSQDERIVPQDCQLRRVKYLNLSLMCSNKIIASSRKRYGQCNASSPFTPLKESRKELNR